MTSQEHSCIVHVTDITMLIIDTVEAAPEEEEEDYKLHSGLKADWSYC